MSTTDQAFIRAYGSGPTGPRYASGRSESAGVAEPTIPSGDPPADPEATPTPFAQWQPLVQFVLADQPESDAYAPAEEGAWDNSAQTQPERDTTDSAPGGALRTRQGIVRWDEHPPMQSVSRPDNFAPGHLAPNKFVPSDVAQNEFARSDFAPGDGSQDYGRADRYVASPEGGVERTTMRGYAAVVTESAYKLAGALSESLPPTEAAAPAETVPTVAANPPHFRPRRPLSFYSRPNHAEPELAIGRQVERFAWPDVCLEITEQCGPQLLELTRLLTADLTSGRNGIALASDGPGSGTTTLALCLAKSLAMSQCRVLLVEADTARPSMAAQLGLEPQATLQELLDGDAPLADAVIHSQSDGISILPIRAGEISGPAAAESPTAAAVLDTLREAYDVVLFDLGHALHESQRAEAQTLLAVLRPDAAFAVANSEFAERMSAQQAEWLLGSAGCRFLGTIETFTTATPSTLAYA